MTITPESDIDELAELPALHTEVDVASRVATRHSMVQTDCDSGGVHLGIGPHTACDVSNYACRKRRAEEAQVPMRKQRKVDKIVNSNHLATTKTSLVTPSHTPSSRLSLKVTKPINQTQTNLCTNKGDDVSFLACSGDGQGYQQDSQIQTSSATIEQVTPRSTSVASSPVVLYSDETIIPATPDDTPNADSSDVYPLDEGIVDDDLTQLMLPFELEFVKENHIPPLSVQGWDHGSQSAAEYDPTLKFTPPSPLEDRNMGTDVPDCTPGTSKDDDASEDLLGEDVDWDAVLANTNIPQEALSATSTEVPRYATPTIYAQKPNPDHANSSHDPQEVSVRLTAFVRPQFPSKVRDRPSVPGLSSDTILRTCFRTGAMISQTACCFNHQQTVLFELYARVTYSSRETLSRKQHFQFVDLFKDQQPYPAATLSNWRADSQLDKDSARFLDTRSGPRLCWCMCKPVRDTKAAIGWTYTVLKIREISWEEVRWAKRIICGDDYEEDIPVIEDEAEREGIA
ncbi:hypothetical protein F5Y08DRAFT_300096 [Xylaria arbuscula]|nr:hypothetical protein F5Y08DRAFT_300096 [Xylaria arbuscula]